MSAEHDEKQLKEFVKQRYGQIAEEKSCGCGPSCCGGGGSAQAEQIGYSHKELAEIPADAVLGLGCGNPTALADIRPGETVLDLGSGGGIDVFLAARRVGPTGKVIGVDMTEPMIARARRNAAEGGFKNVDFRLGEIEKLPVESSAVDLIISNCVINLAPDKSKVFAEAHRVLKPGGRLMISDLVTTEVLPEEVRQSFPAWAECIAGAMLKDDYLTAIKAAGFDRVAVEKQQVYYEEGLADQLSGKILSISVKAFKR